MTLSSTDISGQTVGWTCRELTFEEVLSQGEHLVYYFARVLRALP